MYGMKIFFVIPGRNEQLTETAAALDLLYN